MLIVKRPLATAQWAGLRLSMNQFDVPQRRGARPSHRDIGQIALRLGGQRCAYGKQHAEPPQMIDSRTLHSMCSQFHYTMYVRA